MNGSLSASGRWSQSESKHHINYLELLASFHALQCFVSNSRSIHVRLALDNSAAVAYINNMGGVRSPLLDSLSSSIWEWCKLRSIFISAQHIPGKANNQADALSKEISSNLDWSLNDEVFHEVISQTFIPEIDLFASRLDAKTAKFISWHPQPGAVAVDAFSLSWGNMNCYAFPPLSLLPRVLAKIRHDKAVVLLIAPMWPTQSWYPLLLQLQPSESPSQPRAAPAETQTGLGRLHLIRKTLSNKGFSKQAVDIICSSWTAGTEKQYKGVWDKWSGLCRKRQIDLLQASVTQVVEFLTDCFHEGKGYSTINTYRSALSATLCAMNDDRDSLGSHPLIARLLKGVYILRPPTPRYSSTWDVSKVTDYLKTLAPLRELSFKLLTLKTVMLCALASAQRQQTLSALDLNFRKESQDSITFVVTDRLKTSRPGKSIEITFSSSGCASICPLAALKEYISRSETLTFRSGHFVSKLFLSLIRPYNPVSSRTIARWIMSVLQSAGIDTSKFKAHSVRGAATSRAYFTGTPVADLLKLADWSSEHVFRRHYLREVLE